MRGEIERARRDAIGDAFGRSVARSPGKDALVFGARRWTYAEFDAGANRVANALIEMGLEKGDRAAAYGKNSDAYVLLWLGCLRAGVIHVPVNFSLTGGELLYILGQSGAKAIFYDSSLEESIEEARGDASADIHKILHGGKDDILATAESSADSSEPDVFLGGDDVAQICYTSGTTSAPKGAMMTHRAYVSEYMSCVEALEYRATDRGLHSLPLYHTAQMHVFLMPHLLVGATNFLVEGPAPEECCRTVEAEGINSMFAPPTVWISFLRHPAFNAHDLAGLEKIQYGASIMPVPILRELRERLPSARIQRFAKGSAFCKSRIRHSAISLQLLPLLIAEC